MPSGAGVEKAREKVGCIKKSIRRSHFVQRNDRLARPARLYAGPATRLPATAPLRAPSARFPTGPKRGEGGGWLAIGLSVEGLKACAEALGSPGQRVARRPLWLFAAKPRSVGSSAPHSSEEPAHPHAFASLSLPDFLSLAGFLHFTYRPICHRIVC